jgi:putative FmdB family regulatory protein
MAISRPADRLSVTRGRHDEAGGASQLERRGGPLPIYTYECQSCSSTLERRQSFSDDPLTTHDECGGSLRRVIHPAGIVFKGSGFYNTDYKNSTGSNDKAKDSTESKADGASTDTSSDNKASTAASTDNAAGKTDSTPARSESKSESKPAAAAATTP